jgi:hypothetical protein
MPPKPKKATKPRAPRKKAEKAPVPTIHSTADLTQKLETYIANNEKITETKTKLAPTKNEQDGIKQAVLEYLDKEKKDAALGIYTFKLAKTKGYPTFNIDFVVTCITKFIQAKENTDEGLVLDDLDEFVEFVEKEKIEQASPKPTLRVEKERKKKTKAESMMISAIDAINGIDADERESEPEAGKRRLASDTEEADESDRPKRPKLGSGTPATDFLKKI